ncbi:hypothetical protein [Methylomonas sp. AM2-LC]|uniref:hypothetical protein n=1 Tax=Methylomonas sp. AM2-LC TaxID=3153301 RepID=UPI003263F975
MNKVQKPWSVLAKEIVDNLRSCTLSNRELAIKSGVDYFAIRRFRKNGVHNKTKGAASLCTYFQIIIAVEEKVQISKLEQLVSELTSVWDGSESHAKLLTNLIRSTKSFKVEERNS